MAYVSGIVTGTLFQLRKPVVWSTLYFFNCRGLVKCPNMGPKRRKSFEKWGYFCFRNEIIMLHL